MHMKLQKKENIIENMAINIGKSAIGICEDYTKYKKDN